MFEREYEVSDGSNTITRVHMWIMKEYGVAESWTKLLSACLEGSLTGPFGVRKSGEVVFRMLAECLYWRILKPNKLKISKLMDTGTSSWILL